MGIYLYSSGFKCIWPVLRHLMAVNYKRVQVGIKLMEGEAITEGKKSYKVSEVGVLAILNYKDF